MPAHRVPRPKHRFGLPSEARGGFLQDLFFHFGLFHFFAKSLKLFALAPYPPGLQPGGHP